MTLNSADYQHMKDQSTGEAAKSQPAASEVQQLGEALKKTNEQLAKQQEINRQANDRMFRLMEETSRSQNVLRAELAKQVAPTPQPAPQPAGDNSWQSLLGISTNQEEKVATAPNQGNQSSLTDAEFAARYKAMRDQERQEENNKAIARNQEIQQLRERLQAEAPEVMADPIASTLFRRNLDGINNLRPDISLTQAYEIALSETKATVEETGRAWQPKGRAPSQPQGSPPSNPYMPPSQGGVPSRSNTNANDPFSRIIEQGSPESLLVARKKEIDDIRGDHLKKFRH